MKGKKNFPKYIKSISNTSGLPILDENNQQLEHFLHTYMNIPQEIEMQQVSRSKSPNTVKDLTKEPVQKKSKLKKHQSFVDEEFSMEEVVPI